MENKFINNSKLLKQELQKLYSFLKNKLKLKEDPRVFFNSDEINANKVFGKTGFYDSSTKEIHLFINNRHIKDILRSFAHEIIHFYQDLQGRLTNQEEQNLKKHYFLNNKYLKELEREAFEKGNLLFREYSEYAEEEEEGEIDNQLKENKMKKIVDIVKRKLNDEEKKEDVKSHFEKRNEQIYERLMEKVKKSIKKENEKGDNI